MTVDLRTLDPDELAAKTHSLRALARALVGDEHQAEDLAQETWVTVLGKSETVPCPAGDAEDDGSRVGSWFGRWITGITKNHARQHRRTHRRRQQREQMAARPESNVEDDVLEHLDLLEHLLNQVHRLEEPYRATILLRFVEGLDSSAAGRRLGVPAATVRSRVKRGLEKLRARMDASAKGGRRGWLIPFAGVFGGSSAVQGILATKAVALAAALAVIAGGWWWADSGRSGLAPSSHKVAIQQGHDQEGAAGLNREETLVRKSAEAQFPGNSKLPTKARLQRIAEKLKRAVKTGKLTKAEAFKKWKAVQKPGATNTLPRSF